VIMLKQRVVTAVILLVILSLLLGLDNPRPFLVFLSIACGATAWEWLRMTLPGKSLLGIGLSLLLFVLTLIQIPSLLFKSPENIRLLTIIAGLSALIWLFAVIPTVFIGKSETSPRSLFWTLFAPISLFSTWYCLSAIYLASGAKFMLTLLAVIWIADIAAYFGGKAFGKHKLAVRISPGKTVEGAAFGVLGVVVWIVLCSQWPGSYGYALLSRWGWVATLFLSVLLALISIVGDLFESLLKRRAGIKDSSNLLPGHGGVFDRIDAVIAVVPFAYLLVDFS
jgi:phosphatidate cytidylyltransferase